MQFEKSTWDLSLRFKGVVLNCRIHIHRSHVMCPSKESSVFFITSSSHFKLNYYFLGSTTFLSRKFLHFCTHHALHPFRTETSLSVLVPVLFQEKLPRQMRWWSLVALSVQWLDLLSCLDCRSCSIDENVRWPSAPTSCARLAFLPTALLRVHQHWKRNIHILIF